jgi:geranylgeranyl pyrophosphate synthase
MSELLVYSSDFSLAKAKVRKTVEDCLQRAFDNYPLTEAREAARYAVLGRGHRWRAIVAVASGQIFCSGALEMTLPLACGVELAHAASLVLDDLPSMDNAKVRRGKPCTHLAFPSWVVDLTPVFLITMAYQISLDNPRVSEERRLRAALEVSAAGLQMIIGQGKDVLQEHANSEAGLLECYRLKSGALYAAAAKAGAILCGASENEAQAIYLAGLNLGLSYQMLDDVADVVTGAAEIGKHSGMDAAKWTAVDWLGVDGARRKSREFREAGLVALKRFGPQADWLRTLVCEASYKAA